MKTQVLMKRPFNEFNITQRSGDKFFNSTELLKAYNKTGNRSEKEMKAFFVNKGTQDFMTELVKDMNSNGQNSTYLEKDLYSATRGVNGGTFMHPYLFVKFAMWLSPEFEVQIIKWVYDNLIDYRNQAGDHYVEMCKSIQDVYIGYFNNKPDPMVFMKEASYLNLLVFNDVKGKKRNEATELQLDKLNRLQLANIKLIKSGISLSARKEQLRAFADLL